jgi:hypothetical protein
VHAATANRLVCPKIVRSTRLIVSCGFEDEARLQLLGFRSLD